MWIVRLALQRPATFLVMAILIVVLGIFTILQTPIDVFPVIDIPVASIIWTYPGMSPDDMAKRIVTISERSMTTTVGNIEHIESESLPGVGVIKVYFQPGANVAGGIAQITATAQTVLRALPPGITPPLIIQYNASSVPVLQMGVASKSLSEQQLYDEGMNFVRTQLATVQGASIPLPYGGKARQIMVDLDTQALLANGMAAADVSNAITAQNLILPSGTAKMGTREYNITLNSSPDVIDDLNNLPIRIVNGNMVHVGDVAHVHDGSAVQTNIIDENGRRASLLTILKSGDASTLSVVDRVKQALPKIAATLPKALNLQLLFDQSIFVRASVTGVVREALIAALLTAAMILLFLGSLRSTLIVAVSIPLSILASIIVLGATGNTLNVMTLGGLALAVGVLVDDATVTIENIHRYLAQGLPLEEAILDGAGQIAGPTLVSTLSICIVFVPVFLLSGAAKSLFTPLALSVVYAMLASYVLSRTLAPVLAKLLLIKELHLYSSHDVADADAEPDLHKKDIFWRSHEKFNVKFEIARNAYRDRLAWALNNRRTAVAIFCSFFLLTFILVPFIGEDFFPTVDAGQFRLHVRAPAGTRIEETERLFFQVEQVIRQVVPAKELNLTLDNIGLPQGINLAFTDSASVGPADGEILVSLNEKHGPTQVYVKELRERLNKQFPQDTFFFQPADIVTQILNFGLPAPLDIQVVGRDKSNYAIAQRIERQVRLVQGAVDVHIHQVIDEPQLDINVDRERAEEVGLTQQQIASDMLTSLSSSGLASPDYWLDPKNGVSYLVAVQTPQSQINSVDTLLDMPLAGSNSGNDQMLSNLAQVNIARAPQVISHYNVQPVYDIYANVQGRDLGGVASDVNKILDRIQSKLPRGTTTIMRGQVQSMNSSFLGLGVGLIFAVMLVYFLLVINYESWIDPLVIICALPGAISGIIWMLFLTNTTFSVPSLMGAIMCIGVSTANSILVVAFANERRLLGDDAVTAALAAGYTRLRPVLMTALAMIIGMIPMALGLGEGGEQNAPLGRAVIGGLSVATFTTLFLVPIVYSVLRRKQSSLAPDPDPERNLAADYDYAQHGS